MQMRLSLPWHCNEAASRQNVELAVETIFNTLMSTFAMDNSFILVSGAYSSNKKMEDAGGYDAFNRDEMLIQGVLA